MPVTSLMPAPTETIECSASSPAFLSYLQTGGLAIFIDPVLDQAMMFCAAQNVTPAAINQMASQARGLVSVALGADTVDRLGIPVQPVRNRHVTWAQTVSIEARNGITTGISAADRARTIRAAVAPDARPEDIVTPGHVFPIAVDPQNADGRAPCTVFSYLDAILQLIRAANAGDGAVVSYVLGLDGTLATAEEARSMAQAEMVPTIDELGVHRHAKANCLEPVNDN